MLIKNTASIAHNKLNIMIYGPPGVGKTRFCGSAEPEFKTLVASAESGLLSLRGSGIDYVEVKSLEDLRELLEFLRLSDEAKKYKCFAIDSGTEIQQVCMDSILKKEGRDKPQLQDWGTLNNTMVGIIRAFRDTDISFIMTALEDTDTDHSTGEVKCGPLFQGKISKTISGYFDEVFYSFSKKVKDQNGVEHVRHMLLTSNNGKYMGKDRSGALPLVVDPDFKLIHKLIFKTGGNHERKDNGDAVATNQGNSNNA